ncbi:MAG: PAS domain S-box protein [Candidatus Methanoperedens sp.]|nr:PAS domain S-box protein [Candidatus Methanoperedens sp.]
MNLHHLCEEVKTAKDIEKPKQQLIDELAELRRIIADLEKPEKGRRRADEALQVSETRYRRLFETAQDGILLLDADTGKITDVNPFLADMLGYSHEELLGKKLWDIGLFKDIVASKAAFLDLQTRGYVRYEDLQLETKDGRSIDVEFVSNVYLVNHNKIIQCNIRDITRRRQAEKVSHEARRYAENIIETVREPFVVLDKDLNVLSANRSFYSTFKVTPGETVGNLIYDIGNRQWDIPSLRMLLEEILPKNTQFKNFEVSHKFKTIGQKTMLLNALQIYKEGIGTPMILLAIEDITKKRRMEDELRKYREHLEQKIEERTAELKMINEQLLQDITERKRAEERLSKLNGCFLNFGPEPLENINRLTALFGELMGATCALYNRLDNGMLCSWGQWNTPQDYNSMDKPEGHICYDTITRGSDEVLVIHNLPETLYARTDPNVKAYNLKTYIGKAVKFGDDYVGSLCVVYQNDYSPGEEDKWLMGIIASAIAVEEKRNQIEEALKESEKRFRSVVHSTPDAVIIADGEGNVITWNKGAKKIFLYDEEEVLGKPFTILMPERYRDAHLTGLKRVTSTGEYKLIGKRVEMYGLRKDGTEIPVELSISTWKTEKGTFYSGIINDITERKKAEETRLENLRLAAADKAKSEFLANMSHELRTPLNASIGFSELLTQGMAGELSEKQKHFMDNILTSNQFLLTLINDILDLSKIEAGKIELVREKMPVPVTIKETLSLIKEKASKHNVLLKTEFDPGLEFIWADKQRFKQVLFNLLSNAIKFSKEEAGTVTITAKKEGDMAKVSVSDTGIGIREENIGKLFHKFEQLESGISQKYGGTGLGLAITKQLVELHGGRIWAESRLGEGSTFTFMLPIVAKNKENKR